MRVPFLLIEALTFAFAGCASAQSLYLTTSAPREGTQYKTDDSYTFIAPYITNVQMQLSVSIVKVTTSAGSTTKEVSPTILRATAEDGHITYLVSCDLTSALSQNVPVTVSQVQPKEFNGDFVVEAVTSNTMVVKTASVPHDRYIRGGTITGVSCPPPGDTFNVTFGVIPIPTKRGYLYLHKNSFFNDSVNLAVGNDGMLSSSDTSSVQQITAILTELAQTAAPFVSSRFALSILPTDARQKCYSTVTKFVKSAPYYKAYTTSQRGNVDWKITIDKDELLGDEVALHLRLVPFVAATGQVGVGDSHPGLVAFFPVPASAQIYCAVTHTTKKVANGRVTNVANTENILLSAPTVVTLYTESHFLDPQRDFLTNPQDTLTFNAGIITGHKYVAQSAAKTIVDTITAPIRAIVPSVSVQQTVQVQTGGGKPDQTTTTTQTTTGPPKSQ